MNLSNWYIADDPRRAIEVASTGVELARRVGHGDWAASLAANVAMAAFAAGDWDTILQNEAQLDGESLTTFARFGLIGPASVIRAHRGVDQPPVLDTVVGRAMLTSGAAQDRGSALAAAALIEYAAGDLRAAVQTAYRSLHEMPEGTESLVSLVIAAHGLVELRDADALAEAIEVISGLGHAAGEWLDASLGQLHAALTWLRGDPITGERGYREAMEAMRRLDLAYSLLLAEMGMAILGGPGLRGGDAIVQEARSIAGRLGASQLRERMDRAIGSGIAPQPDHAGADVSEVVA